MVIPVMMIGHIQVITSLTQSQQITLSAIPEMIIRVEEITTETVTTGLTTAQQIIAKDPTTQT